MTKLVGAIESSYIRPPTLREPQGERRELSNLIF